MIKNEKTISSSKFGKKKTIRTKLFIIPITLVILSTISLIISVSYQTYTGMLGQMERDNEFLMENVVSRLNDNDASINSIEHLIDTRLYESLDAVKFQDTEELESEDLVELADTLTIDELNIFDEAGQVTQSNIAANIGGQLESDHPIFSFLSSSEETIIEEPRETEGGELEGYYKYGVIKNEDGTVSQLGVDADDLIQMQEYFNINRVISDLMTTENVLYAGYLDKNYTYTANSSDDFIGENMSSTPDVVEAIDEGKIISERRNEVDGEVLDMIYPVVIDGENQGAFRIGFSVEKVNSEIIKNVLSVVIIKIITIALIIFVLYRSTKDVISKVKMVQRDMEEMSKGDFSNDVPEEMLERKDEFGDIAIAGQKMKDSIRDILKNVTQRAELVAAHSEELTATANQSAQSANELTTVIEEIASSSTTQAHDVENGATAVQELDHVMQVNDQNMNRLNNSTDEVNSLKDEGLELIRDLVDKTEETRQSIQEISEVITETNTSAENIVKALEMIKNISDQTNLLALNASIEAARAGEAGAGFAVVAEEIRKLAEDSSNFTGEIEHIVKDLTLKTETAVDTMELVDTNIDSQGDSVKRTDLKFQGISGALEEIHEAITKVNESNQDLEQQKERLAGLIENLAAVAEENAAGSEEASASVQEQNSVMAEISNASEELAETAEVLNNAVSIFKI